MHTRFPGSYGSFGITKGPDDNLWTTDLSGPIRRVRTTPPPPLVTGTFPLRLTVAAPTAVDIATYSVRIAAAGAAGAREATAPRALKLR